MIVSGGTKRRTFSRRAIEQQPFLHAGIDDLAASIVQLDADEQSLAANFADKRKPLFQRLKTFDEILAHLHAIFQHAAFDQRFITAKPAAQDTGLPPKVEAWLPGTKLLATSSRASIAPSGKPPPKALANVMMSGLTPKCS